MKVTGGQNWESIMLAKLLFLSYFCPGPDQPGPQPTSKSISGGELFYKLIFGGKPSMGFRLAMGMRILLMFVY